MFHNLSIYHNRFVYPFGGLDVTLAAYIADRRTARRPAQTRPIRGKTLRKNRLLLARAHRKTAVSF
jgi:hypothetical protein